MMKSSREIHNFAKYRLISLFVNLPDETRLNEHFLETTQCSSNSKPFNLVTLYVAFQTVYMS